MFGYSQEISLWPLNDNFTSNPLSRNLVPMSSTSFPTPSQEEVQELLLCCRFGDFEDVQEFVSKYGPEPLNTARDDRGNTTIHMASANGHLGTY